MKDVPRVPGGSSSGSGVGDEVKELLEGLEEDMLNDKNIISLVALSELEKSNKMAGSPEEFLSGVNANPNDHELRFKLAEAYLAANIEAIPAR